MRISDWSSYVCSSDRKCLNRFPCLCNLVPKHCDVPANLFKRSTRKLIKLDHNRRDIGGSGPQLRKKLDRTRVVYGKSVSVSVDLGGRRIIQQKSHTHIKTSRGSKTTYPRQQNE